MHTVHLYLYVFYHPLFHCRALTIVFRDGRLLIVKHYNIKNFVL